jgi:hypothetical protein
MAEKAEKQGSLWDDLPKAEQERIKRHLNNLRDSKTAGKPDKAKSATFNLKGYCRCELSAADKEQFKGWEDSFTLEQTMNSLAVACQDGYLLKMGASGNGYQASYSAASTEKEWDGYVLVAHAGTAERAAKLLVFKHEHLMQRSWSEWLAEDSEDALR